MAGFYFIEESYWKKRLKNLGGDPDDLLLYIQYLSDQIGIDLHIVEEVGDANDEWGGTSPINAHAIITAFLNISK